MNPFSLFGLFASAPQGNATKNRPAANDRFYRPMLESLEGREVPSASPLSPPALNAAHVAAIHASTLTITDINVTNVAVTGANSLLATLDVTGTIAGQNFTIPNVQVPITITPDTSGPCPILHLSLEIEDLNLLGLHVELNNSHEGPITVDINAIPSSQPGGGLLGDILCGLTGALNTGGLLGLTGTNLTTFTGAVQSALNGVFDQLLGGMSPGSHHGGGHHGGGGRHGGGHQCDLVNLEVGPINLNVLGLEVATSGISLEVYAVRGSSAQGGGLLGNLLCGLDGLLDTSASANAINGRVARIIDLLGDIT
jgi:hypothetical protein